MKFNIDSSSISELVSQMTEVLEQLETSGKKWAEAKSVFDDITNKKDPTISSLMANVDGSQAYKEQVALGSNSYANFLKGLSAARSKYLQAQVEYDLDRLKVECIRSVLSIRKEEVKNFKG